MYLVGYVCGPMLWGPISESYGRKWTVIVSFAYYTIFAIASAVAPTFAALVVFRLMVGIGGSCAISVVGGICADVYHDPAARGRSMAIFMVREVSLLSSGSMLIIGVRNRQRRRLDRSSGRPSAGSSLWFRGAGRSGWVPCSRGRRGRCSSSSLRRTGP